MALTPTGGPEGGRSHAVARQTHGVYVVSLMCSEGKAVVVACFPGKQESGWVHVTISSDRKAQPAPLVNVVTAAASFPRTWGRLPVS